MVCHRQETCRQERTNATGIAADVTRWQHRPDFGADDVVDVSAVQLSRLGVLYVHMYRRRHVMTQTLDDAVVAGGVKRVVSRHDVSHRVGARHHCLRRHDVIDWCVNDVADILPNIYVQYMYVYT